MSFYDILLTAIETGRGVLGDAVWLDCTVMLVFHHSQCVCLHCRGLTEPSLGPAWVEGWRGAEHTPLLILYSTVYTQPTTTSLTNLTPIINNHNIYHDPQVQCRLDVPGNIYKFLKASWSLSGVERIDKVSVSLGLVGQVNTSKVRMNEYFV